MTKPLNVMFVLCDQLRKDWLGCAGHPSIKTPNLDKLAARGLRCEHNIVANPICSPNRMSMLTGQHAHNHGLWTNGIHLNPLPPTIADHLYQHGVRTANFGKIHISPTGTKEGGSWEARKRWSDRRKAGISAYDDTGPYAGFQHVELTIGHGGTPAAHYEEWFFERGGTIEMLEMERDPTHDTSGLRELPVSLHHTTFVAERTCAWLEQHKDENSPFFAHVSFPDPHHPFDPPREAGAHIDPALEPAPIPAKDDLSERPAHYAGRRDGRWTRKGLKEEGEHPGGVSEEETRIMRARTTAMVQMIDQAMGDIFDTLERTGQLDNTVIFFTSDHGDALGDHGVWGKGPWGYRSIIETPLLIAGPGIASGVSEAVISDVDLAPTIAGLMGVPPLPFADGLDLRDHLSDGHSPTRDAALVEYRNGFGANDYACAGLVSADETYIRYQDGVEELTDLRTDPEEHDNIAGDNPERCMELRGALLNRLLSTEAKGPRQVSHA